MEKVLYEASFDFKFLFILIIILIGIVIFPLVIKQFYQNNVKRVNMLVTNICCLCAGLYLLLFFFIAAFSQISMYNKTVGAYQSGDYQIVEGYVENFSPMPYGGHSEESFDINGVHFSYSDYNIIQGYRNAKSHGGVIKGNGQHLKVGYVYYDKSYGNIIVYIEELP